MGIGSRRQIKVIDETPSSRTGDGWVAADTTILRVWAEVRSRGAGQDLSNSQMQVTKFFEFRFRWREDISLNANCKVVYNGRKYQVTSLERESEKNFYWLLRAENKNFS